MSFSGIVIKFLRDKYTLKRCVFKLLRTENIVKKCPKHITIEINGIPDKLTEDLDTIFITLCRFVSCDISYDEILTSYRILRIHPRPVIVKVKTKKLRDKILKAVALYNAAHPRNNLSSLDLNIPGYSSPLLLSKYPSPMNKVHRQQARRIARECGQRLYVQKPGPIAELALESLRLSKRYKVKRLRTLSLAAVNKSLTG